MLFRSVMGSLFKIAELAAGGAVVARSLGGRLVSPATTDRFEKQLLNVVEEMAIASGVPTPPVYLLPAEMGINAFAAGFAPTSAVVAVSRGSLEYLTRDELQGVVGHEFSHILNGDMRLNVRLMGILHGILLISLIGYYTMRIAGSVRSSSSSDDRKSGAGVQAAMVILGILLMIIGYLGEIGRAHV